MELLSVEISSKILFLSLAYVITFRGYVFSNNSYFPCGETNFHAHTIQVV
jgi:hypothetical protein